MACAPSPSDTTLSNAAGAQDSRDPTQKETWLKLAEEWAKMADEADVVTEVSSSSQGR